MRNTYLFLLIGLLFPGNVFSGVNRPFQDTRCSIPGNLSHHDSPSIDSLQNIELFRLSSFKLTLIGPAQGIQFYREGILFLSDTRLQEKIPQDHIVFGTRDTYFAMFSGDSITSLSVFSRHCRIPFPPDAMSFSGDYKTMYLTRPLANKKGPAILKIYRSDYEEHALPKDCKWSENPEMLSFCQDNHTYMHPAISNNGAILVFASDRSPGIGKMDLFVVRRMESGWTEPMNLGDIINSEGNDLYPFLDAHQNLFFSTDGHGGQGGYDLFVCPFNGNSWDSPVNLGQPVNTAGDEMALKFNHQNPQLAMYTRQPPLDKIPQLLMLTMDRVKPGKDDTISSLPRSISEALLLTAFRDGGRPEIAERLFSDIEKPVPMAEDPQSIAKAVSVEENPTEEVTFPMDSIPEQTTIEAAPEPEVEFNDDQVIFRVQIMSGSSIKEEKTVTINGRQYQTFAYFYKGVFRYCVGEFTSLDDAVRLQRESRQSGYTGAFVAAFMNDDRVTDPTVFRRE